MGKLLIGGFIPGVIMAIVLCLQISLIAKRRSFPKTKFVGFKQIYQDFWKALPGMLAPIILVGGILSGWFTPTEAATVAVAYAIVVGFSLRTLTLKGLWQSFKQSAMDSAAMLVTFIGASLIGLIVTRLHVAEASVRFMSEHISSPAVLLLLLNIVLLIAGCLMDTTCNIIMFTPILMPLIQAFGIDPVHFGVVMVFNLMIGLITPPMGGILFVTCRVAGLNLKEILKEIWPFIIWLLVSLLIVTYVPQTVTWLPSLFIK